MAVTPVDIRRKWGVFWRVFHMLASRCPLSLVVTLCNFLYFLLGSWGTAIGFDSISCHFWNQSGPIMSPPLKTVNSEVATTKVYPFRGFLCERGQRTWRLNNTFIHEMCWDASGRMWSWRHFHFLYTNAHCSTYGYTFVHVYTYAWMDTGEQFW